MVAVHGEGAVTRCSALQSWEGKGKYGASIFKSVFKWFLNTHICSKEWLPSPLWQPAMNLQLMLLPRAQFWPVMPLETETNSHQLPSQKAEPHRGREEKFHGQLMREE